MCVFQDSNSMQTLDYISLKESRNSNSLVALLAIRDSRDCCVNILAIDLY